MPTSSFGSLSVTSPCGHRGRFAPAMFPARLLLPLSHPKAPRSCLLRPRCASDGQSPARSYLQSGGKEPFESGFHSLHRGFVQNNNGCVFQHNTGDGDLLPLTAGKLAAVFADMGVPAIRQLYGKFVHIGKPCRLQHLLVGSVLISDSYILHNGVVEQSDILKHNGEQENQHLRFNFGNVHASHRNPASAHISEPRRQS